MTGGVAVLAGGGEEEACIMSRSLVKKCALVLEHGDVAAVVTPDEDATSVRSLQTTMAGFLSIDCGLDGNYSSGYKDPDEGITYVPDGTYVDAGENHRVAADRESGRLRSDLTVRSFPSGVRNCYALPTVAGAKYPCPGDRVLRQLRRQEQLVVAVRPVPRGQLLEHGERRRLRGVRGDVRGVGELGPGLPGENRRRAAVRFLGESEDAWQLGLPPGSRGQPVHVPFLTGETWGQTFLF
ncbi:hypothetical protein OsJ_29006 [Oryza sativa Japonica Group]|uniref:Malectin-like domain-containing protein n=1 Tax=Oryza sativa subsp. japonica TaxID=39947 RepID=B9G336_ORYSJ|nr:hypothetical protein OsJ_29006 [Oryza sativa Japonica Group]